MLVRSSWLVQRPLGVSTTTATCILETLSRSHTSFPTDHSPPSSSLGRTSVKAAGHGVSLAGGTLKEGGRPVDEGAGLSGLCLGPSAVPELGAHHQKALGWGLWGHQPRTEQWR